MSRNVDTRAATVALPTSATAPNNVSDAIYVGDLDPTSIVLQAAGTASASFVYETSVDKAVWFQCGATLVETVAFTDQTNMTSAGSNPRAVAQYVRLRCSAFVSITSIGFVVSGRPSSSGF